jgi:branched-chain amino acid aminotransferase
MKVQAFPYAFFEGKVTKIEDAKVSIMTNALQYGTAFFGGIRGYYNAERGFVSFFRIDDHIKRFLSASNILGCKFPYSQDELKQIILDLIAKNQPKANVYLRPFGYVGNTELGPNFANITLDFALYMIPLEEYMPLGKGLNLVVSSWQRISDNAIPTRAKISGGYANSALARKEATDGGFDEAILLNSRGYVSEGSAENIFIVRNGKLITPGLSEGVLEGITRRSVMQMAAQRALRRGGSIPHGHRLPGSLGRADRSPRHRRRHYRPTYSQVKGEILQYRPRKRRAVCRLVHQD